LIGGSAKFPGLPERLTRELSSLLPPSLPPTVTLIDYPTCASWVGGSLWASITGRRAVRKEDYDTYGPTVWDVIGTERVDYEVKVDTPEARKEEEEKVEKARKEIEEMERAQKERKEKEEKERLEREARRKAAEEGGIKNRSSDCNVLYLPLGELANPKTVNEGNNFGV
jgi:actin-related protein